MSTRSVDVVAHDAKLGLPPGFMIPLGLNGLQVSPSSASEEHGYLYLTNSAWHLIGRIPVDLNGNQDGEVEDIASMGKYQIPDGLAVDSNTDSSCIAVHPDSVVKVSSIRIQDVLAPGLLEPTSLALAHYEATFTLSLEVQQHGKGCLAAVVALEDS